MKCKEESFIIKTFFFEIFHKMIKLYLQIKVTLQSLFLKQTINQ